MDSKVEILGLDGKWISGWSYNVTLANHPPDGYAPANPAIETYCSNATK